MNFCVWKDEIIEKSKNIIAYKSNMSENELNELQTILSNYLDEGISIIKSWRKLKDHSEFEEGLHDSGIIRYINDKYLSNGREYYQSYNSGGISSTSNQTPESRLKSTCKQRM